MKQRLFLLIYLLMATGCLLPGTDTGNPSTPTSGTLIDTEAWRLANIIGDKLASCYGNLPSDYTAQINAAPHTAPTLGITDLSILTLNDAATAERAGQISVNTTNMNTCKNTVGAMECSVIDGLEAYNSNQPSNFDNIYLILDAVTACTSAYSEP
jgi:hypothetical protein